MNTGAYRISQQVPYFEVLRRALDGLAPGQFVSVHPDGEYASTGWKQAAFLTKRGEYTSAEQQFPELGRLLREKFPCKILSYGFLAMEPESWIKPHRDLRGTMEFGCVRLHIPVVTHADVDFRVSRKRIRMLPGELWALNTSYLHQVVNKSPIVRVHFVMDVELNDWVWRQLPAKQLTWYFHKYFFFGYVGYRATLNLVSGKSGIKKVLDGYAKHVAKRTKKK